MSCDSNDNELKLTQQYKCLLLHIRPLIDQLDKSRDVQLCLLWLSKLEQCSSWERNYRNKILGELCRQVKSNCLKAPFNNAPPNGPLRNVILGDSQPRDWTTNQCSEIDASAEEGLSTSSHQTFQYEKNSPKHQSQCLLRKGNSYLPNLRTKNSKQVKETMDHSECFAIQKAYQERAQSDQMVIEKYQEIIKSLVSQQLKSDVSPNKLKKMLSTYENKLADAVHSLRKVQDENEILRRKIENFAGNGDNLDNLKNENEALKKKILKHENEKRLLERKCEEIEKEKSLALHDLMKELNEVEHKVKDGEKRYKSLEKKYEESYRNFETEFEARMNEKEKIHLNEISTLENTLQEKEDEIKRLKEEMNNKKANLEQEIISFKQQVEKMCNVGLNKEKIKTLKTKAKRLEKMQEHMTVLFQSELQHILAKKDFYIASLEMQLKMNNLESGGSIFSSDFHNSLNQKIVELEAQYRKLLEDSEQQFIERRQLDLQKIHSLEKQLLSLGGVGVNEAESNEVKTSITPDSSLAIDGGQHYEVNSMNK